jgi:hypothetical protein
VAPGLPSGIGLRIAIGNGTASSRDQMDTMYIDDGP